MHQCRCLGIDQIGDLRTGSRFETAVTESNNKVVAIDFTQTTGTTATVHLLRVSHDDVVENQLTAHIKIGSFYIVQIGAAGCRYLIVFHYQTRCVWYGFSTTEVKCSRVDGRREQITGIDMQGNFFLARAIDFIGERINQFLRRFRTQNDARIVAVHAVDLHEHIALPRAGAHRVQIESGKGFTIDFGAVWYTVAI